VTDNIPPSITSNVREQLRALVVGAHGNLGRACVNIFSQDGWEVISWVRDVVEQPGERQVDAADPSAVAAALKGEKYDLVVLAQGYQKPNLLRDGLAHWPEIFRSNLQANLVTTVGLLQAEALRPGALVVYCSSIQAVAPRPGRGLYAIAKAGTEALMRTLAVEAKDISARAVALRMGQLSTPMRNIHFAPAELSYLLSRAPLGQPEPTDVARFILALYEQPALTGCVIDLDGGHRLNVW